MDTQGEEIPSLRRRPVPYKMTARTLSGLAVRNREKPKRTDISLRIGYSAEGGNDLVEKQRKRG